MNKKVAIVACAWPPNGGGMGNNAYYLAKEMKASGFLVQVFTPNYPNRKSGIFDFTPDFLKVFWPIGKAGFMFGLLEKLKSFDIIQLEYPFFGSDLIVWWFKHKYPEKRLVVHYMMDPVGNGIKKVIFKFYTKLFLKPIIKLADLVCILSFDHARNSYLAQFLKLWPNKFVEVPNGVDTGLFFPKDKDVGLMKRHNLNNADKIAIFVGGLDVQHYFKGVEILLQAFARPDLAYAKLLIVGDGNLRPGYEKLAKELKIDSRVHFTGWIDNNNLTDYYNLADVLILPSTDNTECFGIVVAEAMACAKATIVSDWPGVRSTLVNNETGFLVKPGDINDLANKINILLNDKEKNKEFGQKGVVRVVELYDWKKIVNKLKVLYEKL